MTAHSKAAKRRAKKSGKRSLFQTMTENETFAAPVEQDKPLETVTEARARHTGVTGQAALHPMLGEDAGVALYHGAGEQAPRLWDLFKRFDSVDEAYSRRIIGQPRFPNVAKLEMLPETFEARAEDTPDTRTDDEKSRDAVNAWMKWQGLLGCLTKAEASSIKRASRRRDTLHNCGLLTPRGYAFVNAMQSLDEVERRA